MDQDSFFTQKFSYLTCESWDKFDLLASQLHKFAHTHHRVLNYTVILCLWVVYKFSDALINGRIDDSFDVLDWNLLSDIAIESVYAAKHFFLGRDKNMFVVRFHSISCILGKEVARFQSIHHSLPSLAFIFI